MSIRVPLVACFALLLGVAMSASSQTPAAIPSVLAQVESVDATTRTLKVKLDDGSVFSVSLAEKGTVLKVAPGQTSLQNAATIEFGAILTGDRVLVRGGNRSADRLDGALRIVVMAKSELAARDENDARAWRERGVSGTLVNANPAEGEFTIRTTAPAGSPAAPGATPAPSPTISISARSATIHRYADHSVKFAEAKPSTIAAMAEGDQVRVLGTRSEDGKRLNAEKIVFGSYKTMALAIEKVDTTSGVVSVKDLESNQKFSLTVVPGGTIRRIPAEMGQALAAMSGGGRPGGGMRGGSAPQGEGRGPGGAGGPGGPGGPGGRRGMEDLVERFPSITIGDLKKDDWVGAVVSKVDASGKAVAFNVLAGIEVFASRANRSGGVDVGMPAGLLDGGLGGQ